MSSSGSIAGAVIASIALAVVLIVILFYVSNRRRRVKSVPRSNVMLDLAADNTTIQSSSPPRKAPGRRFTALLSIFSFGRKRSRTVSSAKSVINIDTQSNPPHPAYTNQARSLSASGVYSDIDSRPPGHRLPYQHPILPNQQQSIDTFTATRTHTQTQTRTYTYTGTDGDYTEPWLGSDSGIGSGDARSASPAVLRRPSYHARAPSASAHVLRVIQNHEPSHPTSASLDPLTEKATFRDAPRPEHPTSAPIPIAQQKSSTLEPAPIRTFGPSSTHLPSSAATFGMPSTTSLKLPTPDPDDRRSIAGLDDDADVLSLSPSHDYDVTVPDPASRGGFPASVASSYFSLSPPNAQQPPQSLFGNSSVDVPPSAYASSQSQSRTRRPSDSVSRRQPSFATTATEAATRTRKPSAVSLTAAAREIDAPPPLPTTSGPLRRPSMKSFDVTQSTMNTSEMASHGHGRPLPSRPAPLTIPKAKSFADNLSMQEEDLRASSPAIAGLSRTYTRAEKGKGKLSSAARQDADAAAAVRRLPPVPTRAQTLPLEGSLPPLPTPPTVLGSESLTSSPALTSSEAWKTPSTAFTSPPPSSTMAAVATGPRKLPPIPGQQAVQSQPVPPPPRAKRSLPAIPVRQFSG